MLRQPKISRQEILDILRIALLAPSVHNTQPWLVKVVADGVYITLDPKYVLHDGDPTGRQTIISLGIFCEAICLAADDKGYRTTGLKLSGHSATLHFKAARLISKKPGVSDASHLLSHRSTDRSIYRPAEIAQRTVKDIESSAKGLKASVRVIEDESLIQAVAELTSHGIGLALSNPSFRKELSSYLILPGSRQRRGINVKSLYISPLLTYLEPLFMRLGLGVGAEVKLERKRWLSASAIVVILADGDFAHYWFDVGRAYLRASLAIERAGLSQATSAAIVEASNYHDDVESMIDTNQRILSLIRIGKGSKKRYHSPRVKLEELLH